MPVDKIIAPFYTQDQVEEIARFAAQYAIEHANLDNLIRHDVVADTGGDDMASNHKERYYYTTQNGNVEVKVIYGKNKQDTDLKFMNFLCERAAEKPHAPLLSEFINNTYRKSFMRKLAPTTFANYNVYIDRYIIPVLGSKHMDMITVSDIQDFYDWMAHAKEHGCHKNLVADTITRVSGLLGRIYTIATDLKLVNDNPIKKSLLTNDGEASGHHTALLDNEVIDVKKAIPLLENEQQRLYMGFLAYTGMRREEIVGLGWEHIHLDDGYGCIRRTVTYPDGKNTVIRDCAKTKYSIRDFIIPDPLIDILRPCIKESGYVIHGRDPNKPASLSTVKRLYRQAFKLLGISNYNNHDWRTTFGTQLKEAGMTSAQVADLMGHADTRMVETVYATARHEGIMKHKNALNAMNKIS